MSSSISKIVWLKRCILNKYVGPYCLAEMYAGRVGMLPPGEYANGTDRRTDRRTDAIRGQRNKMG